MWAAFFTGIGSGAGLIVAIGSQNAFVLTQGIRKQYHLTVALICALCDTVLIGAGVAGMGSLIERFPSLIPVATAGGALFLFLYGLKNLVSMLKSPARMEGNNRRITSRRQVVLATLAFTLLNPHVYLDTVIFLGGISGTFPGPERYFFGAGAVTMSFLWFFGLSIGAGALAPLFRKPLTWRILDGAMVLIMWGIAFRLIVFSGIPELAGRIF